MSGLSSPFLRKKNALSSGSFRSMPRQYVNDHNKFLPIRRSGLRELDVEQFYAHGLEY